MMKERQPWDRKKGETPKAYSAFCHYLSMRPERRSVMGAYNLYRGNKNPEKLLVPGRHFHNWVEKWEWKQRVAEYDEHRHKEELAQTAKIREEILITGYTGLKDLMVDLIEKAKAANGAEFKEITQLMNSIRETLKWLQPSTLMLDGDDGNDGPLVILLDPEADDGFVYEGEDEEG